MIGTAPAFASVLNASYTTGTEVPLTATSYTATGDTVEFTLNFAPTTGTQLIVVSKTGLGFIGGTFGNLAQGQTVALTYNRVTYQFVANYYGGTGNDLVLVWKATRAFAWGENITGQLGNNSTTQSKLPVEVTSNGVLAGKTVVYVAAGGSHSVALCSDGTVAAWGANFFGQLGNNSTTNSSVPVLVNSNGVLAGKTVVAVAAGHFHNLALCSDGTVAAWGYNNYGQLGNNGTTESSVPVVVTSAEVLSGKSVVAVTAGHSYSLALCSDGTVGAWGHNTYGQLGSGNLTNSSVPVAVTSTGVLAGRTVVAVAAGSFHSVALCLDGTVAAWGYNNEGQLGNNSTVQRNVPVAVASTGVLSGKTVVAVVAGGFHSMLLCSDDTLAAWGDAAIGQLGNNGSTSTSVPVKVMSAGVLAGRTVAAVAAGHYHSLTICSDGTVAAWGSNNYGQLGNTSTNYSSVPVAVNNTTLAPGEKFTGLFAGCLSAHSLALVASPLVPYITTPISAGISTNSATLGGTLLTDHGLAISGRGVVYSPTSANNNPRIGGTGVANLTTSGTTGEFAVHVSNLNPGMAYSYAAYATNSEGTGYSSTGTFTTLPSTNADLSGFAVSTGALSPAFAVATTSYTTARVPHSISSLTVTPSAAQANATIKVNNNTVVSGVPSTAIPLNGGTTTIPILVTAQDGITTRIYIVTVNREATLNAAYNAVSDVPATADIAYSASGSTVNLTLNYTPIRGTQLMVVKNEGMGFIGGTFSNLPQGQAVALTYNGVTYNFIANYYGGTGNDLVLLWNGTLGYAWGTNFNGQLGNNTTSQSNPPVAVSSIGVLAGKTVVSVAAGNAHSVAVCSDGTLAAWGSNIYGQLGNNTTTQSKVPVAVSSTGVLAGKTVMAVAAGYSHTLALCTDGTVAAWGSNSDGQLGRSNTAGTTQSNVPVAVSRSGLLAGKTVVAVAAGFLHSVALCSDGTLAAWGSNMEGELGNISSISTSQPVAVNRTGVLAGKTVVAVTTGKSSNVVLCSDGTMAAWGGNAYGQLGNNSLNNAFAPVAVNRTGVLAGRTVAAVATGAFHSVVQCSDGTIAAWGRNDYGQLGNNSTTNNSVPVTVSSTGVLLGRTVVTLTAGHSHSMALCLDGTIAAWGRNTSGQLGNNSTADSSVPMAMTNTVLFPGERFIRLFAGSPSNHSLALVASPRMPDVTPPTSAAINETSVILGGTVISEGGAAITGRGVVYDATGTNNSPQIGGTGVVNLTAGGTTGTFSVNATNLATGTAYTFAAYATNSNGTGYSTTGSFTTTAFSAVENWRQIWFGSSANTGNAADPADPYHTGIPNLAVFAFFGPGQNPALAKVGDLPQAQWNGADFTYSFTEPSGVSGINYGAEWSTSLNPENWTRITDTGTPPWHRFQLAPGTEAKRFMRLRVSNQ